MNLHDRFMDRVRYFNRRVTNPLMMTFAGKRVYAVVQHVGRKSGRQFQTPVLAMPTSDGFVIPLPYGERADWCQNVFTAGGCTIVWDGEIYPVTEPGLVNPNHALPSFPRWLWGLLKRTDVYLEVKREPGQDAGVAAVLA